MSKGFTGWDSEKTKEVHEWMKNLPDDTKLLFAINWKIPHTLFNIACQYYPGGADELQNIEWHTIYDSKDLGTWSHSGPVIVI